MSRHTVEHREFLITVGWDRPMNTFFGQVEKYAEEDDAAYPAELIDMGGPMDCPYTNITKFYETFKQKLLEIGIDDFELSQQQLLQLLADQDNVSLY